MSTCRAFVLSLLAALYSHHVTVWIAQLECSTDKLCSIPLTHNRVPFVIKTDVLAPTSTYRPLYM